MEVEATGYEHLLDELDKDEGYETPQIKASIDGFWGGKDTEVGDEIRGIFLEKRTFQGRNNKDFNSIILLTKEGVFGVTENKYLESRLKDINEGDGLKIKYTGTNSTKDGQNEYKTYDVAIKRFGSDKPVKHIAGNFGGYDEQAVEWIKQMRYELSERHNLPEATPEEVVEWAVKMKDTWELSDEDIFRIKVQAAKEVKEEK